MAVWDQNVVWLPVGVSSRLLAVKTLVLSAVVSEMLLVVVSSCVMPVVVSPSSQ